MQSDGRRERANSAHPYDATPCRSATGLDGWVSRKDCAEEPILFGPRHVLSLNQYNSCVLPRVKLQSVLNESKIGEMNKSIFN